MTLSPVAVHETLDERGLLEQSTGSGTYALQVHTPATPDNVARAFLEHVEGTPPSSQLERLAFAERVCYVGASGNVYDRLQDHADGEVRKALFLECFPPVDVVGVWPSDAPFESEFNRARMLSDQGYCVWSDGEVI